MRQPNLDILSLRHFHIETLKFHSRFLRQNPQRDPVLRGHPVLVPKKKNLDNLPVVFVLAGLTGNGPSYFRVQAFQQNLPQVLDLSVGRRKAPDALFVFVDAMSFWGGSQFINSAGTGLYQDYLLKELVPLVKEHYPVAQNPRHWCVMGGSSGGYGALHLVSKAPHIFGLAAAIAPDCFFEMSLLPDIYTALPWIAKWGEAALRRQLKQGQLMKQKEAHAVINAMAMGYCYAPRGGAPQKIDFPVDLVTGELKADIWKRWKQHDPLVFLKRRQSTLKKVRRIYLDVGQRDQYHLQFGARQIKKILKAQQVAVDYTEFDGTHFDIGARRPRVWEWLKKQWG